MFFVALTLLGFGADGECTDTKITVGLNENKCLSSVRQLGIAYSKYASEPITVKACRFYNCWATGAPLGLITSKAGDVVVTYSEFVECVAQFVPCIYSEKGKLSVSHSKFRQNKPSWGCGTESPALNLGGSDFAKWKAGYGTVCKCGPDGAELENCTFDKNQNGALSLAAGSSATLTLCVFLDNKLVKGAQGRCGGKDPLPSWSGTEYKEGGGDICLARGAVTAIECTFTNTREKPGACLYSTNAADSVNLTQCTFSMGGTLEGTSTIRLETGLKEIVMSGCSFTGKCKHISAVVPVTITVIECLQFSNAQNEALEDVTFANAEGGAADDLVKYNGEECPGPGEPTTEEPSDGGEEPGPEPEPGASNSDDPEGGGGEPEPGASDSGPVVPGKPSDDDDDEDDDDDDDDGKGGKNKLSGGEIAAIVIVVLIVIAAIVAVLLFFLVFRRRYGSKSSGTGEEATSEVTTTEEVVTGTGAVNQQYGGDFGLWDSEAPESDPGSKEQ